MTAARLERAGWICAGLALVAVFSATLWMTPGINEDTAWGVLAEEQHLAGRSPTVRDVVVVDPRMTDQSRIVPITWWAPGQQEVIYLLRRAGLSLGAAIRSVVIGAWLIGIVGWSVYFRRATSARTLVPWLIACFCLFRLSHYSAFVYIGGETFLWAGVPIVALLNVSALSQERRRGVLEIAAGFASTLLVLFKYSAVFLAVGFGAAWLWDGIAANRKGPLLRWLTGAVLGAAVAGSFGLSRQLFEATPASPLCRQHIPSVLLWNVTGPVMGLADIPDAVSGAMNRFGIVATTAGVISVGCAVTIVLIALIATTRAAWHAGFVESRFARQAVRAATTVTAATLIGLTVLMLRGGCISFEGRHHQYEAFLLLPFLAGLLQTGWNSGRSLTRGLTAASAALMLFAPATFGALSLLDKALIRTPALRGAVAENGVRLDWASSGNARDLQSEIRTVPGFDGAIFGSGSPAEALLFSTHRLALSVPNDVSAGVENRRPGAPAPVILLEIPAEKSARALRSSFGADASWTPRELKSLPGATLWVR